MQWDCSFVVWQENSQWIESETRRKVTENWSKIERQRWAHPFYSSGLCCVIKYKKANMNWRAYQWWWVRCPIIAILPVTCLRVLLEPLADVSALYEVFVDLIVIARSDQDTQKVKIVTQVLNKRRPHTAGETTREIIKNKTVSVK